MLTDGKAKYIYSEAGGFEELYDLENDPAELANPACEGGHQGEPTDYRRELIAWCRARGDLDLDKFRRFNDRTMGWRWF